MMYSPLDSFRCIKLNIYLIIVYNLLCECSCNTVFVSQSLLAFVACRRPLPICNAKIDICKFNNTWYRTAITGSRHAIVAGCFHQLVHWRSRWVEAWWRFLGRMMWGRVLCAYWSFWTDCSRFLLWHTNSQTTRSLFVQHYSVLQLQLLQQNHSDADALQASAFGKVSHGWNYMFICAGLSIIHTRVLFANR